MTTEPTSNVGRYKHPDPSPKEIQQLCEEIRDGWSVREAKKRVGELDADPWVVPREEASHQPGRKGVAQAGSL